MHDGVLDAQCGRPQRVPDAPSDDMPFKDRGRPLDFDVNFNEVRHAALANAAFFDASHAWNSLRQFADLEFECFRRGGIEQVADSESHKPKAAKNNHRTSHQGGPIVCGFVARSTDQADGNTYERGEGCQGIGSMVPSVGL